MRYVIGVDIGTSGTKTVLFDEKRKRCIQLFGGVSSLSTQNRLGRNKTPRTGGTLHIQV